MASVSGGSSGWATSEVETQGAGDLRNTPDWASGRTERAMPRGPQVLARITGQHRLSGQEACVAGEIASARTDPDMFVRQ